MVEVKIITKLLTPNPYSRPRTKLNAKPKAIVIHWTASPMGRNQGVWNYFENRKKGTSGYGSAHYIVDLDGAIWNCIPTTEIAYHVGSHRDYPSETIKRLGTYPNGNTIGIEFCIIDNHGKMNKATWVQGAKLVAYLLKKFGLGINDIWTHQQIVGWKDCHRYFVENPNEYKRFKDDVADFLYEKPVVPTPPVTSKPTSPPISNEEFYTVKAGDTIWGISRKFNTTVENLLKLNPKLNPQILPIGKSIRIRESKVVKYQIIKGDTLWGISRKFNTTVEKLKEMNKDLDIYALKIGDYIIVGYNLEVKELSYENILPNKILRFGDEGNDVKKLQNALNKLNFYVGIADGIFGHSTLDGLKRYQLMHNGLTESGILDTSTREHMLKQLL